MCQLPGKASLAVVSTLDRLTQSSAAGHLRPPGASASGPSPRDKGRGLRAH